MEREGDGSIEMAIVGAEGMVGLPVFPGAGCKSRHGALVLAIQKMASTKRR